MRRPRSLVVPLVALGLLVLAAPATAAASTSAGTGTTPDRTPPRLVLPAQASFVPGTTIGPMAPVDGLPQATRDIVVRASWSATGASGICGYRNRQVFSGFAPSAWTAWGPRTSLTASVTD